MLFFPIILANIYKKLSTMTMMTVYPLPAMWIILLLQFTLLDVACTKNASSFQINLPVVYILLQYCLCNNDLVYLFVDDVLIVLIVCDVWVISKHYNYQNKTNRTTDFLFNDILAILPQSFNFILPVLLLQYHYKLQDTLIFHSTRIYLLTAMLNNKKLKYW